MPNLPFSSRLPQGFTLLIVALACELRDADGIRHCCPCSYGISLLSLSGEERGCSCGDGCVAGVFSSAFSP